MSAALMIQGTGSGVGKTLVVAGLCRAFWKRGLRVRPFKPQNMSNNAAVTVDGGEIGRAQAMQARACGIDATVDMNPILLKPQSERGAQVILRGRHVETLTAREYLERRGDFMPSVMGSFEKLRGESDLVLVEGAGSPAEVNLREGDQANMGFAAAADIPVILVGDVHRGGVIASIVGTMSILNREDASRIKGFLINNFRGDQTLFRDAITCIEERTGMGCVGVVPHFPDAGYLPGEDSLSLTRGGGSGRGSFRIAVLHYPCMANFDDWDPLRFHDGVDLRMIEAGDVIPADVDLVILPGSKATIRDLEFLRRQGWDIDIRGHVRRGGRVLGICGGYQMLGRCLRDPCGIEGQAETVEGLGLLDVETALVREKVLRGETRARHAESGVWFSGYEMHVGRTRGEDSGRPFARFSDGRSEGARSVDGLVEGTYLHGLFGSGEFRSVYMRSLGGVVGEGEDFAPVVERVLDGLAEHMERHVDLDDVLARARTCGTPGFWRKGA